MSGKGRGNEAHDARLPNTLLQRALRFVGVGNAEYLAEDLIENESELFGKSQFGKAGQNFWSLFFGDINFSITLI